MATTPWLCAWLVMHLVTIRAAAFNLNPTDDDEGAADEDSEGGGDKGGGGSEGKRRRAAGAVRRGLTSRARQQPGEHIDASIAGSRVPSKPMMELKAGSNVWYQAYLLKESQNEAKVRFPCERAAPYLSPLGAPAAAGPSVGPHGAGHGAGKRRQGPSSRGSKGSGTCC